MIEEKTKTKTAVIEVDDGRLTNQIELDTLAGYIGKRRGEGLRVVLVHGAGSQVNAMRRALGVARRTHHGTPVVSESSVSIAAIAAHGLVSTRLVAHLVHEGLPAIGLSGVDLGLLRAGYIERQRVPCSGRVLDVDSAKLTGFVDQGLLPVIAALCLSPEGSPVRVASATAAQAVAAALDADILELISDIPRTWAGDDAGGTLSVRDLEVLIESSVISGQQVGVAAAAVAAIASGVDLVRLGDVHAMRREAATEITA